MKAIIVITETKQIMKEEKSLKERAIAQIKEALKQTKKGVYLF